MPEDVPQDGGLEECADFVLDGSDGFAHEAGIPGLEFHFPELLDKGIADLFDDPSAVGGIDEHAVHPEEGSVLTVEQSGNAVVQDVGHARPPRVAPDGFEGINDA